MGCNITSVWIAGLCTCALLPAFTITKAERTPHQAAQEGIEWLQKTAVAWQKEHQCFGCHNQAQVIMGLAIAKRNKYVVNDRSLNELVSFVKRQQNPDGTFYTSSHVTSTQFAAMALAYYDEITGTKSPVLRKSANWLLGQQTGGEVPGDHNEPPIDQGSVMTTANSSFAWMQSFRETGDVRYRRAAERGLRWIAKAPMESTQDKVFAVMALERYGSDSERNVAARLVQQLRREQTKSGGWQETKASPGPNALATGQVLYAFKQAGVSIDSPEFQRGVRYLMSTQKKGSWHSVNSQSGRPSDFAPTMWAVIGLAGSFREPVIPAVTEEGDAFRVSLDSAILFDFDRDNLKPEALDALADIKRFLLDAHPGSRITVEGHTDDVGTDEYNLELSTERAQAVADWCAAHGIDASLVEMRGYGKSNPRFPNDSDLNRARNRRVEIVVAK
jgi:outer membrane protein OmpA-like peptidoglycan-associated protein